jgi:uncharacterized protein (DUF1499 family)
VRRIELVSWAAAAACLVSCAGARPVPIGIAGGRLAACPASPNCASSDATDAAHAVPALKLLQPATAAWPALRAAVARMPRTRIVSERVGYLHAECTTPLMRYVDDLELELRAEAGIVAVRSASRVGYGDMGANRDRIEELRAALARDGVVAPER